MKPALASQMLVVPPNWKHMKLAGNGPATSSAKLTWIGDLRILGRRGAARDGDRPSLGFERSIVV